MIKKIIILISLCVCFTVRVWAKPPRWPEFEIKSANNSFFAKVCAYDKKDKDPRNREDWKYKLVIYQENNDIPLWTCEYQHTGYGGGMLSDDGSTFVTAYYTYYPGRPVIFIYQNGELKKKILGEELLIDTSKLLFTSDGFIWRSAEPVKPYFFHQDHDMLLLKINTVDGRISVNLNTFEIEKQPSNK